MRVHFENVGRTNKTFSVTIKQFCPEEVLRLVRPYILSGDVDVALDPAKDRTGVILVGGFRRVGTFRWEEDEPAPQPVQ